MNGYVKEFDQWNERKKQTECKIPNRKFFVHEREVWWCSVGVNVGSEIDGKNENFERPVLIVKIISENGFFGVPLTSKKKGHQYEVMISHGERVSFANVSQLRFLSRKRMLRKIGSVNKDEFQAVIGRIGKIFEISEK